MKTFSDIEYENRKYKSKREEFLDKMDEIVPWDELVALIRPHHYNNRRGRPACSLEKNASNVPFANAGFQFLTKDLRMRFTIFTPFESFWGWTFAKAQSPTQRRS